ncbi:THAP domain-containing protein 9, partial [Trachymyrmex cornetzi]
RYIVNLIELQEREGLHTAVKINRRHLNWQREKMNVQLAVQIFSNSVANAIDFCRIDLKLQQFDNSTATSLFIRNMNNIFDLLNSRNLLCKNESQQPISLSNIDRIKENITKYIEYINDLYITENNDNLLEATSVCVFLLVCINGNWKIPVAYYVIRSLSGKERANLIKIVLGSLHKIGAVVVNITMDGCASNISTMNYLGANISAENLISYFMHPISKEKVYLMLDACHMIKLIRNTYDTKRNIHDSSENKIEWRYIVNLIELQEREGLHTAVKINRRYLNW